MPVGQWSGSGSAAPGADGFPVCCWLCRAGSPFPAHPLLERLLQLADELPVFLRKFFQWQIVGAPSNPEPDPVVLDDGNR